MERVSILFNFVACCSVYQIQSKYVRVREKPPKNNNSHVCSSKSLLLIPTLGWHLETPREGHKFLLKSGVKGIPEKRDYSGADWWKDLLVKDLPAAG